MATARTPRDRWIEAGLLALAKGGPDAVRIEPLARALGVTKGGFYGYFADRAALLEELLERWERDAAEAVIEQIEGGGGDAREKLRSLFALAGKDTAADPGMALELAVCDWARYDPTVAVRLRRVDNRRMDYLRELFGAIVDEPDEVEVRSLLTMSLYVGSHLVAADHGARTRAEVMGLTLEHLLR